MKLTPLVEQAVEKAATLHHGQFRKLRGEPPYITHLIIVAMLVADHTDDEEVIAAALLHDSIEDTPYTLDEMATEFGPRVRDIVAGVSEHNVEDDGETKRPWQDRKDDYLAKIAAASDASLMISLADKIHNMRSVIDAYTQDGISVWEAYSAGNAKQLWFHGEVLQIGRERLGDHPLIAEYERIYEQAQRAFATA